MSSIMLSLGSFKFSISSASYNELVKNWSWKWTAQSLIGQSDRLQAIGKAPMKISLSGEVVTTFNNVGINQIEILSELGDQMKPLQLVSGTGDVLGFWCITTLSETSSKFLKGGIARLQSFSMEIQHYGNSLSNE